MKTFLIKTGSIGPIFVKNSSFIANISAKTVLRYVLAKTNFINSILVLESRGPKGPEILV